MTTDTSDFYKGEIVFDKKRTDPTDDLLVVVNPEIGALKTLDGETKRLVKHNDTNKELNGGRPVDDDEPCIACAYISTGDHEDPAIDTDKVYTFPAFRLATVESAPDNVLEGYQPYQWALAGFLSELVKAMATKNVTIESVDDLQVLCMEASIDGEIITKGTQWGLGKSTAPEPDP